MTKAELTQDFITQANAWAAEVSRALLPLCKDATQANLFDCAARDKDVLYYDAVDILGKVAVNVRQFGVSEAAFIGAAIKQPPLFCQKPETLKANVEGSARLLGISEAAFVGAAIKQPSLFCQKPETLKANVEGSARLLGVSEAAFVGAAIKQSSLFYQKPETLKANVEGSARLLGISEVAFIGAAIKQPPLFCQKPETVVSKKPYVEVLAEALGYCAEEGFMEALRIVPAALCYSYNHLHARSIVARLRLASNRKISGLVPMPAAKVEKLIIDHFVAKIEATGKGARALQVMQAQGLIKTLPNGIRPIARPARRADRVSAPA